MDTLEAATLWFMRYWGMDTPDQSLFPHFPALTIYGGFFVLGWVLNGRRRDRVMAPWALSSVRQLSGGKPWRPLAKVEGDIPVP